MSILSWLNRLCSSVEPAERIKKQEPSLFEEGVVVESIEPGGKGRVKLYGIYWSAKSSASSQWSIPVDTPITVKERRGLTLIVEPLTDSGLVTINGFFPKALSGTWIQLRKWMSYTRTTYPAYGD